MGAIFFGVVVREFLLLRPYPLVASGMVARLLGVSALRDIFLLSDGGKGLFARWAEYWEFKFGLEAVPSDCRGRRLRRTGVPVPVYVVDIGKSVETHQPLPLPNHTKSGSGSLP